jgi:hypothetical protein
MQLCLSNIECITQIIKLGLNLIEELEKLQFFELFSQTIPIPILDSILKRKILSIFGRINCVTLKLWHFFKNSQFILCIFIYNLLIESFPFVKFFSFNLYNCHFDIKKVYYVTKVFKKLFKRWITFH